MGILGLSKLIADLAPFAIKESEIKNYFGRKIAIDASMCLYQFLIAVRAEGAQLTSVDGETTSHLMGTFYRTIRLLENGIKPIYVFDGKPPDMKAGELTKRAERREEAQKQLDIATEAGETADMDKFNRRLVRVTKHHGAEAQELLKLMGIPFVVAPCEAEAQCAAMVKSGKIYATATEDMDALTFGTTTLLRHLTFSEARKMPVQEFSYEKVLKGLEFTPEQVCIFVLFSIVYSHNIFFLVSSSSICASCSVATTATPSAASARNAPSNSFASTDASRRLCATSIRPSTQCPPNGTIRRRVSCLSHPKWRIPTRSSSSGRIPMRRESSRSCAAIGSSARIGCAMV